MERAVFLAAAFLAGAFLAAVVVAADDLTAVFRDAAFFAGDDVTLAVLPAALRAAVFFAAVFLAAVFFAAVFLAGEAPDAVDFFNASAASRVESTAFCCTTVAASCMASAPCRVAEVALARLSNWVCSMSHQDCMTVSLAPAGAGSS